MALPLSALGSGLGLPSPEEERKWVYHLYSVICIRDRTAVVIHTANPPRVGKGIRLSPPGATIRDPFQGQTSGHVVVSINPPELKIYGLWIKYTVYGDISTIRE